ncbi:hypothetical protein LCGC14_0196080 [marine sediment metagenome]|uniref:DUF2493 domain-containing protein n=1 Tax=marine sediment metagenome TaxID=412755 RepID=A0A0F9UKM5_9ZZZZ
MPEQKRLWIAGSSKDFNLDEKTIKALILHYMIINMDLRGNSIVGHGAAKGVDTLVDEVATELQTVPIHRLPAEWVKDGKYRNYAGMLRNTEGVDWSTGVIVFWNGVSPGTADVIKKARKAGKLLEIIKI